MAGAAEDHRGDDDGEENGETSSHTFLRRICGGMLRGAFVVVAFGVLVGRIGVDSIVSYNYKGRLTRELPIIRRRMTLPFV